jgi:hypothetical protein
VEESAATLPPDSSSGEFHMSIQRVENHLAVFERDAGLCRYCDEDLLWSYSIFESTKFDRIPATANDRVTCCKACYRLLEECTLSSLDERRAYVRQQAKIGIERYRATAEKIRPTGKGSGTVARLVQAGLLQNGETLFLAHLLPSFLRHPPEDPAFQAIVDCESGRERELIYMLDGSPYCIGVLTFGIFQRGHVNAPYRKTRFSWSVCPNDHWVTKANTSLTELQVRLDWDDLPSS